MNNLRKNALISFCLAVAQLFFAGLASGQGISVYPSRLFYHAAPGSSELQTIHVTNEGKSDLLLEVYLKDWVRDSLGEKIYSAPATLPRSNASWVNYTPQQLSIPAGATKELSVKVSTPQGGEPFTNSMLFLSQINKQDTVFKKDTDGRTLGFVFRVEVGVHIYNATASVNQAKQLKFQKFIELPSTTDSLRQFELSIKNNGEDATDATLRFHLTEMTSGKNYPLPDKMISMLPAASQIVKFSLASSLPKGRYQIMVMADAGDNSTLQVAKKQISYE